MEGKEGSRVYIYISRGFNVKKRSTTSIEGEVCFPILFFFFRNRAVRQTDKQIDHGASII